MRGDLDRLREARQNDSIATSETGAEFVSHGCFEYLGSVYERSQGFTIRLDKLATWAFRCALRCSGNTELFRV